MFVATEGPPGAKMMLVGEAPGKEEDRIGRPFVGNAGRILDRLLSQAGINRRECLIANVARERPPADNIGYYFEDSKKTVPKPILLEWINLLKEEIELYNPNVIVALGAIALWALTGKRGIKAFRGAITECTLVPGKKVLPTYHPQFLDYSRKRTSQGREGKPSVLSFTVVMDLRKALYHSRFPGLPKDRRVLIPDATLNEFLALCEDAVKHPSRPVGVDIETLGYQPGSHIWRLALADSPDHALSIRLLNGKYPCFSEREETELWRALGQVLETCPTVFHNAGFDTSVLMENHGLFTKKLYMDTSIAAHAIWPEIPLNLGNLASLCLDVPAWKHTSQEEPGLYNAGDAANTLALVPKLEELMDEAGVWETYEEEMREIEPASFMQLRGVRVDAEMREIMLKETESKLQSIEEALRKETGMEINYRSPTQVSNLLYGTLGLPLQFKRRKSKEEKRVLTTDIEALKKLAKKTSSPVPKLIIEHRKYSKRRDSFLEMEISPEGRVHTSYNVTGTDTGRWSSSTSIIKPYGPGNLQNIPEETRVFYKAEPGYTIVCGDYVQAEAVVVAYLSLDAVLMKMFKESFGMSPSLRKERHDIHKYTASLMFGIPMDKVTKEQRRVGKTLRHACNYSAGPAVVANELDISLGEAKKLLQLYYNKNPHLKAWHQRIQHELRTNNRTLVTPWGRKRRFLEEWGDNLFRSAYAYIPQSTVGEMLNRSLSEFYYSYGDKYILWMQLHDGMYVLTPKGKEEQCILDMRKVMIKPLKVGRETMVIDVDFKIGPSWGELEEVDRDWR